MYPSPKCPVDAVFMHFQRGHFPNRWFFCPQCQEYWREWGINFHTGRVDLIRPWAVKER